MSCPSIGSYLKYQKLLGFGDSRAWKFSAFPGLTYLLTFLDIFVLLSPASASNQAEMLGSSEEAPPEGSVLDSGMPS